MTVDLTLLEKAAFACFRNKSEDGFKRLLFIYIMKLVSDNPNITTNKAFMLIRDVVEVDRLDFDSAVRALEYPLSSLKINRYRRAEKNIAHLNKSDSEVWSLYSDHLMSTHPELKLWVSE
jgi:hypothetical protein